MPFRRTKVISAQSQAKAAPPRRAKASITPRRARIKLRGRSSVASAPSRARTARDGAIVRPSFTRADLINAESAIGRTIFGPIPAGHEREFFEHSKNVWIWHERWQENGKTRETTMRYEVRESGVYKKLQGSQKNYTPLGAQELENFRRAAHIYLALIKEQLY